MATADDLRAAKALIEADASHTVFDALVLTTGKHHLKFVAMRNALLTASARRSLIDFDAWSRDAIFAAFDRAIAAETGRAEQ